MLDRLVNAHGERIDFSYHPGAPGVRRLIVIGHGVTGHKDRPFHIALAEGFARAGVPAIRLTWPGNGNSEGNFADCTITKEVADLGAVLDVLSGYEVTYAGHSMGAAVGVLRASADPRIRRLVSLAGMVHMRAFAEQSFGHLVPGRDLMWDKPGCILSQAYMDDLRRLDNTLPCAEKITVPWLLVHGDADATVPIQHSRDIFARAHPATTQLIEIPGATHLWEPDLIPRMVDTVVTWHQAQGA